MKKLWHFYTSSFTGLSRNAWVLAAIMLVNRAGTMVLPFLSVYLTSSLGFSLEKAGWVLSMFGLGSMTGSLLGGWLTDKIGQFRVQVGSLVVGGLLFMVMANITSYFGLLIGMYVLSTVSECLRPANAASVAVYAKPENVTRAFSLNRMSVNLGFSIGPAIGGVLAGLSYRLLFFADGFTCVTAGLIFYLYFRNKTVRRKEEGNEEIKLGQPAHRDVPYVLFALLCLSFALVFFQIFSTLPLYYRDVYGLEESRIGALLALNGLLVFALEMPLVNYLSRFSPARLMSLGTALNGLSFLLFCFFRGEGILWVSMIILSLAEVFAMPFMVTVAVQRAPEGRRGSYLGLYSLAYSTAHVLAPLAGTYVLAHFGFNSLWLVLFTLSLGTSAGIWLLTRRAMPVDQ